MRMDTDTENSVFSDKTGDSQETVSEENMFVAINTNTKKMEKQLLIQNLRTA